MRWTLQEDDWPGRSGRQQGIDSGWFYRGIFDPSRTSRYGNERKPIRYLMEAYGGSNTTEILNIVVKKKKGNQYRDWTMTLSNILNMLPIGRWFTKAFAVEELARPDDRIVDVIRVQDPVVAFGGNGPLERTARKFDAQFAFSFRRVDEAGSSVDHVETFWTDKTDRK